jgi:hypothetical protein
MRGLVVTLAIATLAVPAAVPGKGGPVTEGVRLCGALACRDVTEQSAVRLLIAPLWNGAPRGPAAPGPYFSVRLLDERRRPIESHGLGLPTLFYVPRAGALRTGSLIAKWRRLGAYASDFREAARGLRPFPPPRLTRVEVDRRTAADPGSYLRLYAMHGGRADDPAGLYPQIIGEYSNEALVRYYQRVKRHWLPVNLWSSRPSPWGDGANFVWVSRRGSLLRRDGEVIHIAAGLAERIRHGLSLSGF